MYIKFTWATRIQHPIILYDMSRPEHAKKNDTVKMEEDKTQTKTIFSIDLIYAIVWIVATTNFFPVPF